MTRSDIIKMAKEAGFETAQDWVFNPNGFVVVVERFAVLVAASGRRLTDAELRRLHAELERCKQVCAATAEGWRVERDALLEKINGVLAAQRSEGGGCGGFINKPPTREHQRRVAQAWQELHEVIKAAEGEKE